MRTVTRHLATLAIMATLLASTPSLAQQKDGQQVNRTKTLKTLIEQFLTATKAGDKDKVAELTRNMKLTKPATFFASVYDARNAKRLTAEFRGLAASYDVELPKLFVSMLERKRTEVTVLQHSRENPKATGNQCKG